MDIHVSLTGGPGGLSDRIYRQVLDAILDGRLRPGERLPPTRELAARLRVSRNTVSAAYDRLAAEGFLSVRVGAGTFVRAEPVGPARRASAGAPAGTVRPHPRWRSVPAHEPERPAARFDFRVGVPDTDLFPVDSWRRLVAGELRADALRAGPGDDPAGFAGLRAAIARHVGLSRSVRAGADDVIVTHGAQQALDLLARVLIGPGDVVAVEEPGYPPARRLFASHGARVVGVPVDDEGLDVAALPDRARLVYTTPSHQFPLGVPMSLRRRGELLSWAERRDAVIVEDDYDSEFRFADRPLEPLQGLDRGGRVGYVGTFGKTMMPTLRLGFLIAPPSLRDTLRTAKALTDRHTEVATQRALARFIDDGLLSRHLRRATRRYADRHRRILAALGDPAGGLAGVLTPVPSVSGLHLCATLPADGPDPSDVVRRAAGRGVTLQPLADFCAGTPRPGLVLGYGAIPADRIDEGLRRLGAAIAEVTAR